MSTRVGTSQGVKECHENPLLGVFGTLSCWLPEDRNSDIVTNLGESTIAMMFKKDPRCCGFKARKYSCLLDPSGTLGPHQSKRTEKEANYFNNLQIYASYTNGIQAKRRYIHFDEITIYSVSSRELNLWVDDAPSVRSLLGYVAVGSEYLYLDGAERAGGYHAEKRESELATRFWQVLSQILSAAASRFLPVCFWDLFCLFCSIQLLSLGVVVPVGERAKGSSKPETATATDVHPAEKKPQTRPEGEQKRQRHGSEVEEHRRRGAKEGKTERENGRDTRAVTDLSEEDEERVVVGAVTAGGRRNRAEERARVSCYIFQFHYY
ncbi:hypothetical protein RHSIM_Rhsim05G0024100 [Rhododendron simsii]|uniref:Uncharacterized protein n=1 Tax=Rhododendron simsii TaxID=118357 RepID=A0A834H329_RHOSS|nr:hypothetical protein RHSIM_Rhsim05G0024100 [Rhododendron simsii]